MVGFIIHNLMRNTPWYKIIIKNPKYFYMEKWWLIISCGMFDFSFLHFKVTF